MKINLSLTIAVLFCFFSSPAKLSAQEAVVSAGSYFETDSKSISWSLGETVIETFIGEDYVLTQGFQQSSLIIVSVEDHADSDLQIAVYPNPTTSYLQVSIPGELPSKASFRLYDFSGRLIMEGDLQNNSPISFTSFDSGMYLLKVFIDNQKIKTFKVFKQ